MADSASTGASRAVQITEEEALAIGIEAYVYLYPLVSMDVTRRVFTNVPAGMRPGSGPANAFHHLRAFPTADFRDVVRPNFDTLYSIAWLDLSDGPVIVSVPDAGGRYYLLPILDMWTDVFAVPGTRTTGTGAGRWAVVPAGWTGDLPDGTGRIEAPTTHVWVIGRTQTNGPADYAAVNAFQDGLTATPLARWDTDAPPPKFVADPSVDVSTPPLTQVESMPAARYFAAAAELLKLHRPHASDWSQLARLRRVGIEPGRGFDLDAVPDAVRSGLERAVPAALAVMRDATPRMARVVDGWQMNTDTMGVYGNHYLKRAIVTQIGLGANPPEDAIYPLCIHDADGQPLQGDGKYVLHFAKEELPPVSAFWSVTMYDEEGFQVANPLDRFAIGDRDPLHYGPDGSLDLFLQHESPGAGRESNWLPSPPSGRLGVTMRLYAPHPEALDGRWSPPAIRRVG